MTPNDRRLHLEERGPSQKPEKPCSQHESAEPNVCGFRLTSAVQRRQRRQLAGAARVGADRPTPVPAALGEGQPGRPDPATLEADELPSVHYGQRAPRCASAQLNSDRLFASIAAFDPRHRRAHEQAWAAQPDGRPRRPDYTSAQADDDLCRLRPKGSSNASETTPTTSTTHGRRIAFLTHRRPRGPHSHRPR